MNGTIFASLRRMRALIRKESLQILRDPSTFLIAGVLPLLLLLIFGNGVSLDLRKVPVGVVVEQPTPDTTSLLDSFRNSRFFSVREVRTLAEVEPDLVSGRLSGIIVLRADFPKQLGRGDMAPVDDHRRWQRSEHGGSRPGLRPGRLAELAGAGGRLPRPVLSIDRRLNRRSLPSRASGSMPI